MRTHMAQARQRHFLVQTTMRLCYRLGVSLDSKEYPRKESEGDTSPTREIRERERPTQEQDLEALRR